MKFWTRGKQMAGGVKPLVRTAVIATTSSGMIRILSSGFE